MINLFLGTIASLVFLGIIFIPMERVFPAKQQAVFREQYRLDLLFFLGQYLLWGGLVLLGLYYFNGWLNNIVPAGFRSYVKSWPWVLQVFCVVVLSDFLIYWAHRLQHSIPFLWRFHKTHHTSEKLDWLAAHREHPIDSIYTVGIINLPALILGFPLSSIIALITFRGIWAIFIHSNVRLNIGPLKKIIGSPELHHWHHTKSQKAGNYANISPIMDILFGTYYDPGKKDLQYGIHEDSPKTYLGHLIQPLVPKKRKNGPKNIS